MDAFITPLSAFVVSVVAYAGAAHGSRKKEEEEEIKADAQTLSPGCYSLAQPERLFMQVHARSCLRIVGTSYRRYTVVVFRRARK